MALGCACTSDVIKDCGRRYCDESMEKVELFPVSLRGLSVVCGEVLAWMKYDICHISSSYFIDEICHMSSTVLGLGRDGY